MSLQEVFTALVPYFTCVAVFEQGLEERRVAVAEAQRDARAARREYNGAIEALEALSLEIQRTQAAAAEAAAAEAAAAEAAAAEAAAAEAAQKEGLREEGIKEGLHKLEAGAGDRSGDGGGHI